MSFAADIRFASHDAIALSKNILSNWPSTILTGLAVSSLSKPYIIFLSVSTTFIVIYLRDLSLVSKARPVTAINTSYSS